MTAITKAENTAISTLTETELLRVLESSLYPGANPESIRLVLGYCRAAGLDPMQKPVHIVPISVKRDDNYVWIDTVMPGIGLYRTQAARTGQYAGITEPEFGPDKTLKIGEFEMTYPEWCRITVKRIVAGNVVEFTASERWIENYATKKRDSRVPNAMWQRRPYAQLAKCAEAQALRKAFPELVGAQPTSDETIIDDGDAQVVEHVPVRVVAAVPVVTEPAEIDSQVAAERSDSPAAKEAVALSDGAKATLQRAMQRAGRTDADLAAAGFPAVADMRFDRFNNCMDWLKKNPARAA